MKFNPWPFLLLLAFSWLGSSCQSESSKKELVIGFSQCTTYDDWRQAMDQEMRRELSFHENVHFKFRDASGNNDLQIQQIRELLKSGLDLRFPQ